MSLDKLQIENERILKQNEQLINELGDEKECNFSLKENINVQTKELESKNDLIAFYVLDHLKKEKEITRLEQNVMDTNFELAQFERRDNACLQPPIFIRKSDRAHLPKLYESAQIGKGAFGKVYRIEMKVDGILGTYAVKVQDKAQVKRIEVDILRLKLEGLVKCHDILSSENDIYMVLDLYSMTLEAAQEEDETTINSIEAYIDFVTQINASLMALHKLKIAHRDIKAANILTKRNTDGSNVYVLADFGSCLLFCNKNCTKDCHPDEGYTHKYTELVI